MTLSSDRVRKVLKKRGGVGRGQDINHQHIQTPNNKKPNELTKNWLFWAHSAGEICLKFLDESGFCLWSPVSYTYARKGTQKVLEQTSRRGRRLNILGLYSIGVSFDYGLKERKFSGRYLCQTSGLASTKSCQTFSRNRTNYGHRSR